MLASTMIKFAGGVSSDDAAVMAKEMRCGPEFIMGMQKNNTTTNFAVYIRNQTPEAGQYMVPLGELDNCPRMREDEYQKVIANNRLRYCAPYEQKLLTGSVALANAGVSFELEDPGGL
jgi:hypothetical protein